MKAKYIPSLKTKQKMKLAHLGKKYKAMSQVGRINISESLKGRVIPVEVRKKMSLSHTGIKNHMWKGNKVNYRSLHNWVRKNKPQSMFCEKCGKITIKLDASSINHTYERDISKWRWLCRKCHRLEDKN